MTDPTAAGPVSDPRWVGDPDFARQVLEQARLRYPALDLTATGRMYASVNDVVELHGGAGNYALKLYRRGLRQREQVAWEVDLLSHLARAGAPVVPIVAGLAGPLEELEVNDQGRLVVMSHWAPGVKPVASEQTYLRLGQAAGLIHRAADDFGSPATRVRDLTTEVDQELEYLRPVLEDSGRWALVEELAGRLHHRLGAGDLRRCLCHNDLTLDNVHITESGLWVFDFDSASEHWWGFEPQGVYHFGVITGRPWWQCWKAGYERVRPVPTADEAALPWFVLLFQLENLAWKLGLTPGSVGRQTEVDEVPAIVDAWGHWAAQRCVDG